MRIKIDEKALKKLVEPALRDTAKTYNKDFESLSRTHQGRPVEEIRREVKRIFKKHGGSIDAAEAAQYAQIISEGKQVKFEA
ncbi:hypothetical protein CIP107539_00940 [Corynebacterium diphtheriae]|uniref:Uncharacterized protein n=1 Tax=Corynebacterium diphtheriae TaxID=1717 RepID=A0A811G244_CORDP|nr:hypothetical protein [Corynebacterium diphtheriae]MBG9220908.1 hypothetical protein [Corynebacterium diphtheriae bv. mitis]MBG9300005.1 hypothetical protein [Corynebacterium diphtheriae bv. mitis]OJI01498.1 hypothetical protein BJU21_03190 [Corynebacterium diphtheriae]OSQ08533.1 hypothetical protein B1A59_03875 [Corynebacterium diphtheriae]OWM96824.1 hypothetical protein AY481_03995 [Corynebacterium diphtheriae bv. mitis]